MYTIKEITDALKVIQNVCAEHNVECEYCPLGRIDGMNCAIIDSNTAPNDWNFHDPANIKIILN